MNLKRIEDVLWCGPAHFADIKGVRAMTKHDRMRRQDRVQAAFIFLEMAGFTALEQMRVFGFMGNSDQVATIKQRLVDEPNDDTEWRLDLILEIVDWDASTQYSPGKTAADWFNHRFDEVLNAKTPKEMLVSNDPDQLEKIAGVIGRMTSSI